jgi:adenine-specific DNA-methyltransferase
VEPRPVYDAIIGNPPYVRYQDFTGESRARARAAALRAGVPLTGLASSWAAFTVHSALFLKQGGRLGLVLPAELLTVNYAAEVRRFLMRRFATVRLVLFTERVFPGVLEEVVLLLADGYDGGPTDHCELYLTTCMLTGFLPT